MRVGVIGWPRQETNPQLVHAWRASGIDARLIGPAWRARGCEAEIALICPDVLPTLEATA